MISKKHSVILTQGFTKNDEENKDLLEDYSALSLLMAGIGIDYTLEELKNINFDKMFDLILNSPKGTKWKLTLEEIE